MRLHHIWFSCELEQSRACIHTHAHTRMHTRMHTPPPLIFILLAAIACYTHAHMASTTDCRGRAKPEGISVAIYGPPPEAGAACTGSQGQGIHGAGSGGFCRPCADYDEHGTAQPTRTGSGARVWGPMVGGGCKRVQMRPTHARLCCGIRGKPSFAHVPRRRNRCGLCLSRRN